jgi:hypothetical protein
MTTDLSELLAQKTFEELTATEREMVLSEMSEQDYSDQHEMIIAAKLMMAKEAATLQAPVVPIAAGKLMPQKKGGVFALFSHKIPTWAAVAAGILLFLLFNYSSILNPSAENNTLVVAPQVDTVYVEKLITEFRDLKPLQKEKGPSRMQPQTTEKVVSANLRTSTPPVVNQNSSANLNENLAYSDEMLNAERINYTAILQNYRSSKGVSLQNDSISQMLNRTVF